MLGQPLMLEKLKFFEKVNYGQPLKRHIKKVGLRVLYCY